MTTQPNTGPAELRRLADVYKHAIGWGAVHNFNELAAAWEAADARAARAEAALERARALVEAWKKQVFELPRHVTREIEDCADELAAALAPDGAR